MVTKNLQEVPSAVHRLISIEIPGLPLCKGGSCDVILTSYKGCLYLFRAVLKKESHRYTIVPNEHTSGVYLSNLYGVVAPPW